MTQHIRAILEYPKFLALLLSCLLAYMLFHTGVLEIFGHSLAAHGYIAIFIAGLLFSFGFTTPFAIGLFLAMAQDVNPYAAALVGGLGAFMSDLFIFEFVRFSFDDEIHRMRCTRWYAALHTLVHHERVSERMRRYILWSIAGLIIASPLPDEFGVTLISSVSTIDARRFSVICFAFNTLGIFTMLMIGKVAVA
jgi:hypothetical protein